VLIEIITFRLRTGVDEAEFLAADERVRTGVLYRAAGIVRATTARNEEGEWVLIVLWGSEEPGADAMAGDLAELVDPATVERRRYRTFD
jgi:hypothetical protein